MKAPRHFRVRPRVFAGGMALAVATGLIALGSLGAVVQVAQKRPDDIDTTFKVKLSKPPAAMLAEYNRSRQPKPVIAKVKPAAPSTTAVATNQPKPEIPPDKSPVKITYEGSNHS